MLIRVIPTIRSRIDQVAVDRVDMEWTSLVVRRAVGAAVVERRAVVRGDAELLSSALPIALVLSRRPLLPCQKSPSWRQANGCSPMTTSHRNGEIMRRGSAALAAGLLMLGASASSAGPASASSSGTPAVHSGSSTTVTVAAKPKPIKYKNCTALNKVYKHGVGKKGAKDEVAKGSKPVTNFTVSTKTYTLNKKSDRDKDGIACEKH